MSPSARPPSKLYIGLMSGTSLDGADAVLADFSGERPVVLWHAHRPFPPPLRDELLALQRSGPDELHRSALAANGVADLYAGLVGDLLLATGLAPDRIAAIGAHGQTVRHRPELGYTLQLNAPARLAEATGIDVVADLRSRDVAAGGQGAPLVPAFHAGVFGSASEHRVVANIGGIANLTDLAPGEAVRGWDCGPGNVLMDLWIAAQRQLPYDAAGAWAATGRVLAPLLTGLLQEPWLMLPPPKSTGRDLFHSAWLQQHLDGFGDAAPQDVQATLAAYTAECIALSVANHIPDAEEFIVCGGGAFNPVLLAVLRRSLAGHLKREIPVLTSDQLGVAPDHVEALAFAWLAQRFLLGAAGNLPSVTGAHGPRFLGALYPGSLPAS